MPSDSEVMEQEKEKHVDREGILNGNAPSRFWVAHQYCLLETSITIKI